MASSPPIFSGILPPRIYLPGKKNSWWCSFPPHLRGPAFKSGWQRAGERFAALTHRDCSSFYHPAEISLTFHDIVFISSSAQEDLVTLVLSCSIFKWNMYNWNKQVFICTLGYTCTCAHVRACVWPPCQRVYTYTYMFMCVCQWALCFWVCAAKACLISKLRKWNPKLGKSWQNIPIPGG